jgi:short-subunit dehydrogenase
VADINTQNGREDIYHHCKSIGTIDFLINNAGMSEFSAFETQSQNAIEHMLNTNLIAPILLTQQLLPLLRLSPSAMIINIGSTFGSIGYPGFSAYCASKFGMRGFTEALRRELAGSGIQVAYLAPRATRTNMNSHEVNNLNKTLGNAMDEPAIVAIALKNLIQKNQHCSYLGWPEKLFVRINQLLPFLVDQSLHKQLPTIRAFLAKT